VLAPLLLALIAIPTARADDAEIDLLCANVWGLAWPLARQRRGRLAEIPEAMAFGDYDVVGLQELWRGARRHLPATLPEGRGDSGLALAGRVAAEGARVVVFRHRRGVELFKRKGVLLADVPVAAGAVVVGVTHLQAGNGGRYARTRMRQAQEILDALPPDRPVVLMGDFNLHAGDGRDDRVHDALTAAGFEDVALAVGADGPTYLPENPWAVGTVRRGHRFDRVYVRDGGGVDLVPVAFEVLDGALSDHQPLAARVAARPIGAR